jgi:glycosyltransferase involved in cell wall biosynthesis
VDALVKIALSAPTNIHALARFTHQRTEGIAPGLGSTATTPLITELLRRGHEVTVYTLSRGWPTEDFYDWGRLRIFVGPYRERHIARNFFAPEIAYLTRTIRADRPAFVHAHWTYEFALGALRSKIHTVTTIHDLPWNVLRYYRDPHRAVRLLMAYAVALEGTQFTAVSNDAAAHFRRYFKPGSKIEVIYNGLPDRMFELQDEPKSTCEDRCTFATILQGWSRRKNATAALEAFGIVRSKVPEAKLFMFGLDYEKDGPAHCWARQRGLDAGVTFVGELTYPELQQTLREQVDVIVHPSLDESFSMAALEGMALKKPVIAGRATPGVREVLGFGKGGILVNLHRPKAIADAMIRLVQDQQYRRQVARDGFERASSLYRLEEVVSQYEALYQRILVSQRTSPIPHGETTLIADSSQ